MKPPPQQWERLLQAARQAPPPEKPATGQPAWTDAVVRAALPGAALGKPSPATVLLAWLAKLKLWLLLALAIGGGLWTWHHLASRAPALQFGTPAAARAIDGWAGETLDFLKTWYPLDCEEAGDLAILLRQTSNELKNATNAAAVIQRFDEVSRSIEGRLKPTEQPAFQARQRELRAGLFGDSPP